MKWIVSPFLLIIPLPPATHRRHPPLIAATATATTIATHHRSPPPTTTTHSLPLPPPPPPPPPSPPPPPTPWSPSPPPPPPFFLNSLKKCEHKHIFSFYFIKKQNKYKTNTKNRKIKTLPNTPKCCFYESYVISEHLFTICIVVLHDAEAYKCRIHSITADKSTCQHQILWTESLNGSRKFLPEKKLSHVSSWIHSTPITRRKGKGKYWKTQVHCSFSKEYWDPHLRKFQLETCPTIKQHFARILVLK